MAPNLPDVSKLKPSTLLRLHTGEGEGNPRHATWLELFFDLVFVFAIAELAHLLHSHSDWAGIFSFALLFIPVWWLWIDFSYYADQFNVDTGPYRDILICSCLWALWQRALAFSLPLSLLPASRLWQSSGRFCAAV